MSAEDSFAVADTCCGSASGALLTEHNESCTVSILGVEKAYASEDPGTQEQVGFMVIPEKCIGCGACVHTCMNINRVSSERLARRIISTHASKAGSAVVVSTSCMHCEKPSCMEVCPAGAISKDSRGIVHVDKNRCIGCKYCHNACPFGVPKYTSEGMDKCDFCTEAAYGVPQCATVCPAGALYAGTVSELREIAEGTITKVDAPTRPSFFIAK